MFVDASAIVAILNAKDRANELEARLDKHAGPFFVSPLVHFEAVVALARAKADRRRSRAETLAMAEAAVDDFVTALNAQELPIDAKIGRMALDAAKTFGKFISQPADLNFRDCSAYACANAIGSPLLHKGGDFALTDVNDAFEPGAAGPV